MLVLKCFWAGQLVSSFMVDNNKEIAEELDYLKKQLKAKNMTHVSCRYTFVLGELCVDVMKGTELYETYNLKA